MKRVLVKLLGVLLVMLDHSAAAQSQFDQDIDAKDVKLILEATGPQPMPFQAVRLRLTLRNVSAEKIGPVRLLEWISDVKVKRPGSAKYEKADIWKEDYSPIPNCLWTFVGRVKPYLKPDEEMSVSFAVAADWSGEEFEKGDPTFAKPGEYELRADYYLRDSQPYRIAEATVKITVAEPAGADAEVFQILRSNPALISAMMRPVDAPDKKLLKTLQMIYIRYPKSSYAPYAHFAYARYLKRLERIDHEIMGRVEFAVAADELEETYRMSDFPYKDYVLSDLFDVDVAEHRKWVREFNREHRDSIIWIKKWHSLARQLDVSPLTEVLTKKRGEIDVVENFLNFRIRNVKDHPKP